MLKSRRPRAVNALFGQLLTLTFVVINWQILQLIMRNKNIIADDFSSEMNTKK